MEVAVKPFVPGAMAAWDGFVRAHPEGTFFHLAAWRAVIESAFGHRTCFAFAERDGAITGVLPLAHVRSLLFGNTLTSLPFCVYGGPLAVDAESAAALEAYASTWMDRCRADAVEFRFRDPVPAREWVEREALYETFRKPIEADTERNMKAIPRKQRAMVRKAIQNGLVSDASHDFRRLHAIYAASVRNLGTPVFSRRYF